jgi:hypothetical protein
MFALWTGLPGLSGMTADELRTAQQAFTASEIRTHALRLARDHAIQQALTEHWTQARISEATGLTRGRIGQLAQRLHPPLGPAGLNQNGTS